MRLNIILISTFLSWFAYDLNLFRRRSYQISSAATAVTLDYGEKELREQKQIARRRLDVIPPWLRTPRKQVRLKCNYFSSAPRDHRYSDQRKIRRRINNL